MIDLRSSPNGMSSPPNQCDATEAATNEDQERETGQNNNGGRMLGGQTTGLNGVRHVTFITRH